MQNNDDSALADRKPRTQSLGGFIFGMLFGAALVVALMTFRGNATVPPAVDLSAIRSAAQEGAATAIALQQQEALSETPAESSAQVSPQSTPAGKLIGPEKPPAETTGSAAQNVALRAANTQGKDDAPVTIIEYSDFNCGYCLRFHQQTYPAIVEQYVKTGKVKFVYKQFAILGQDSVTAAQASECAADQGKFWDYHDALFAKRVAGQDFSADSLIASANALKLDTAKFTACLNDNQTANRVQADLGEAQQLGFRGTPTFMVNGKILVGAQPLEVFQREVDSALAGKR